MCKLQYFSLTVDLCTSFPYIIEQKLKLKISNSAAKMDQMRLKRPKANRDGNSSSDDDDENEVIFVENDFFIFKEFEQQFLEQFRIL